MAQLEEHAEAAKLALRRIARRMVAIDEEIAELDAELEPLVRKTGADGHRVRGRAGHTTQLLVTAGQNIDRHDLLGGEIVPESR